MELGHEHRAPDSLALIVITVGSVVPAVCQAAVLENGGLIHTDKDHFGLASQKAPYLREPLGKPRLTLVSDGKPLRRLLLGS